MRQRHRLFLKSFSNGILFGTEGICERHPAKASLAKLCRFLMQRKVYLFWKKGTMSFSKNGSPSLRFMIVSTMKAQTTIKMGSNKNRMRPGMPEWGTPKKDAKGRTASAHKRNPKVNAPETMEISLHHT
jgi:hypothetical protein